MGRNSVSSDPAVNKAGFFLFNVYLVSIVDYVPLMCCIPNSKISLGLTELALFFMQLIFLHCWISN